MFTFVRVVLLKVIWEHLCNSYISCCLISIFFNYCNTNPFGMNVAISLYMVYGHLKHVTWDINLNPILNKLSIMKCGIKLLIHFQTALIALLKFGNGSEILTNTLVGIWELIILDLKLISFSKKIDILWFCAIQFGDKMPNWPDLIMILHVRLIF